MISALFLAGSTGVQEDGQDIVTHFPSGSFTQKLRDSIAVADPGATVVTANAAAIDYSEWRAAVVSHRIGGLTVAPPWLASDGEEGRTIVIDPAMAFGTGEHATTRGVIRLMQQIPEISGLVADLGSGSAILSIAAAKLGAAMVAAIEVDADAIGNAHENVAANGVADRVHVIDGDAALMLPLLAPVDVVLANIVSSVLLCMLPAIAEAVRVNGYAILSGILVEERTMMLAAIGEGDWRIAGEDTEAGWWSVLLERR
ncbi:MAG: 50S ribosomal protein L11 methyltransferase [Gemmatimonadaceae bacterium]